MKNFAIMLALLLATVSVSAQNTKKQDWAQFYVFQKDNARIAEMIKDTPKGKCPKCEWKLRKIKAVLMGDSITELWWDLDSTFFRDNNLQILWQTGRWMYDEAVAAVQSAGLQRWVKVHQFISRMDLAYAAADVIVSRAGAIAISELCLVGKPVVLIPSPNVAEDHQTKNAMALVNKGAALMVRDEECGTKGLPTVLHLMQDVQRCETMGKAIKSLAVPHAADKIVDEIDKLIHTHINTKTQ